METYECLSDHGTEAAKFNSLTSRKTLPFQEGVCCRPYL
jgi:hypothetical protein